MPTVRTVLLAPDKFKGCLTATEVCAELHAGLRDAAVPLEVVCRPMADGGDGTLDAALSAGYLVRQVAAADPLGHPTTARIATRGSTALIELAEVCGLVQLPLDHRQPLLATTFGVGLVMRAAIEAGFTHLVVGVGGSASTDGGTGAAMALGARVTDRNGDPVRLGGEGLRHASTVDLRPMADLLDGIHLTIATDVTAPLIGDEGAARVFAAQKGATADQIAVLEAGMENWATRLLDATGNDVAGIEGAGAAGGLAAPFLAADCATITSGAELVLDLTGTREAVTVADVVVTGEGRWDGQTTTGKAPYAVLAAAGTADKPVIAVAGSFAGDADLSGIRGCHSLTDLAGPDRDPVRDARILLREIGTRIAHDVR